MRGGRMVMAETGGVWPWTVVVFGCFLDSLSKLAAFIHQSSSPWRDYKCTDVLMQSPNDRETKARFEIGTSWNPDHM